MDPKQKEAAAQQQASAPEHGQYYQPTNVMAEKGAALHNQQYIGDYQSYYDAYYQNQQFAAVYAVPVPQYADAYTTYPSLGPAPATKQNEKRGVLLWGIIALACLLILVIGLSAGLGVSQRDLRNTQNDLVRAQSSLSAMLASATAPATAMAASTTGTASAATKPTEAPTAAVTCPGGNNTVMTSTKRTGNKKYQQLCGIDYSGSGAKDLATTSAVSFDACMNACASRDGCQGAGWGYVPGDTNTTHTCYMKTNLTQSHIAASTWSFALLLSS